MEKKSASDNNINMKKGIFMLHTTYQAQKKGILELDTTYQAPKRRIWSYIQRIKHSKEEIGVRYDVSSTKK